MAIVTGALVSMGIGTAIGAVSGGISWFKSRGVKKKNKARMAQLSQVAQQKLAAQMAQVQAYTGGAMGGLSNNFMSPSGIGGSSFGQAPKGYFPPGMG